MSETEYIIRNQDSGVVLSGPKLAKPVRLPRADQAVSLARHLLGRHGGIITAVNSNGVTTKSRFAGKEIYSRAG